MQLHFLRSFALVAPRGPSHPALATPCAPTFEGRELSFEDVSQQPCGLDARGKLALR